MLRSRTRAILTSPSLQQHQRPRSRLPHRTAGNPLSRGLTPTITWTSSGSVGSYVKIELLKAGVVKQTISTSTPNDGTYSSWTIPSTLATGTDYRIRITSTTQCCDHGHEQYLFHHHPGNPCVLNHGYLTERWGISYPWDYPDDKMDIIRERGILRKNRVAESGCSKQDDIDLESERWNIHAAGPFPRHWQPGLTTGSG